MDSRIFIAPPGAGKTTFKQNNPGKFIDPEESIDWRLMASRYGLYNDNSRRNSLNYRLEHELDWPSVWVDEILPRLRVAILLKKDILMGMVTPSCAEVASYFFRAFKKNITVVLPGEEKHFEQVWANEIKRARTWGGALRGWQHTYWIRLLLRGLAGDLGLKTSSKFILPQGSKLRTAGISTREAVDDNNRKFIEIFFGRWAELDEADEIVTMYTEVKDDKDALSLKCDKTGKLCGRGGHNCQETIDLKNDVNGRDIKRWIARDKIKPPKQGKKNALIFFVGTLAPFHHGHLDALNSAKAFLEKEGWNVIGGYASVFENIKKERVDTLYPVLGPAFNRSSMLELGLMDSDWLSADFPVDHVLRPALLEEGNHPVQLLAKRLREQGALSADEEVATFWVNGKDGYMDPAFFSVYAKYAVVDKTNPLRLFIMDNRPGKDDWMDEHIKLVVPSLLPFLTRHSFHQTNPSSATRVREALMTCNRNELNSAVGLPLVEAYLVGLMNKMEVHLE